MSYECHCPPEDNEECCKSFGDCCHQGYPDFCSKCADDEYQGDQ